MKFWEGLNREFEELVITWNSPSLIKTAVDNTQVPEQLQTFEALESSLWIANHTASTWRLRYFCQFPKPMGRLGGYHCASDDEVKAAVRMRYRHQSGRFYCDRHIGEGVH